MRPYTEIEALRDLVIEESYVLAITATPGQVQFELDLVLTPRHPDYAAPKQAEQYCFRRGVLTFREVARLLWSYSGNPPAVDASGEIDYGQIDTFQWDDAGSVLEGTWGRMEVQSAGVDIEFM